MGGHGQYMVGDDMACKNRHLATNASQTRAARQPPNACEDFGSGGHWASMPGREHGTAISLGRHSFAHSLAAWSAPVRDGAVIRFQIDATHKESSTE